MLEKHPLMYRFAIVIILPLCVGAIFAFIYLKSSLTLVSGTLEIEGLENHVEITHDGYGTPAIVAKTDHDAYFALGFKHASDRLWQLEVQRRMSQGRLSEIFGAAMLSTDITMRTLGLYDAAEKSVPFLKEETVNALTAYAGGINAWIAQSSSFPIEFQLFGVAPEPWTIVDSLGWQKVFAMTLSGNMTDELRRNQLQRQLTPDQIRYIYPFDPISSSQEEFASVASTLQVDIDGLLDFGIGHPFTGSNAWVVSGAHTKSGNAILANDPHVGLQLPSVWYAAALKGDRLDVSGMTLVGLPMIILGQNTNIAWGGTNLLSDQQDIFVETTSPQHPNQYLNEGQWEEFDSRKERINVGAAFPAFLREKLNPVEIVVRNTKRGPVISDTQMESSAVFSLRWSALDAEDRSIEAFYDLQYAGDWNEFRQALTKLKSPGMNFLYADREGNIGHQVAGKMPERAQGVGILPLVATSDNGWLGYQPFELLPSVYNPENGFIVSANERVDHSAEMTISHEWAPSARHDRITELLKAVIDTSQPLTVADMERIQGDSVDLTALELLPYLLEIVAETQQEHEALEILKNWNGEFTPESAGATIFASWSHYLTYGILGSALNHSWQRPEEAQLLNSSLGRVSWAQLADILSKNSHGWCQKNQSRTCLNEIKVNFKIALDQLTKISGTKSVSEWRWRDFSTTEYVHQPLGQVKGLEWLFKKSVGSVTSQNSVNASNLLFDPMNGFTQNFGASFRQVFELDKNRSHWYMISTGQSGNVVSPHFDDMITDFSKVRLAPYNATSNFENTLKLIPPIGQK